MIYFPAGRRLCVLYALSLALLPGVPAAIYGQSAVPPRIESDERAYVYGKKLLVSQPDWQDLLDAGLWASGWDGASADRETLVNGVEELLADRALPLRLRDRGEYILGFMHRRFLRSYAEHQSRLDVLARRGSYNCVSSAVLYAVLARAAGLELWGVITRDHAFITLDTGEEHIDIETTTQYGFEPGSRREFHDGFGRTTGYSYVPARNYRERNDISILELVSVILSNRIAEADLAGRYNEGPGLALDRFALLSFRGNPPDSPFLNNPNKDIQDHVVAFGAALLRGGREEEALAWMDSARHLADNNAMWEEFSLAAVNNMLVKKIRKDQSDSARALLEENRFRFGEQNYAKLSLLVEDAEMVERTRSEGPNAAEEALAALAVSGLAPERIAELREFVILKEGNRVAKNEGWPAGTAYLEQALERFGPSRQITDALRVYRSNRIAELHNAFADLYNARDYRAAKEWIEKALAEFPGERQFQTDLSLAEEALRRQRAASEGGRY
jgi:hypothetical protein